MRKIGTRARWGMALAAAALLWGCGHVVSPDVRKAANPDLSLPDVQRRPASYEGQVVIWGGRLLGVVKREDARVLIIGEMPLDVRGRPRDGRIRGRFLVKDDRGLAKGLARAGGRITVAGTIIGQERGPGAEIRPVLSPREIHVWSPDALGPSGLDRDEYEALGIMTRPTGYYEYW